jgi:hypothetical protein
MATQQSTVRKLTLKVRMFLQKYGIPLLEGTHTRFEGGIPEPKTASVEGFKKTLVTLLGDKVGQHTVEPSMLYRFWRS